MKIEDCHYFHPKPRIEQDAECSVGSGNINDSCVLNVNRGLAAKWENCPGLVWSDWGIGSAAKTNRSTGTKVSKNHLLKLANTRHTPDTGGHRAEGGQTLYLTYFFTFLDIFFLMLRSGLSCWFGEAGVDLFNILHWCLRYSIITFLIPHLTSQTRNLP